MKLAYCILSVFAAFLILQEVPAAEISGTEIIKRSEDALRGDTQYGEYRITIKTRRWTRTIEMKSWDERAKKKSFSEIIAPAKEAGNRFLLIDKEMRQYIPKLQKSIRFSPSMMLQSWMGSDFTNDDIVKMSSIVEDYTHQLKSRLNIDGVECYEVELLPKKNAAVVWGKILYYVRVSDFLPVREEFYSERGLLKKKMNFSSIKKVRDRTIPTVYKMETVGKDDQYTMMELLDVRYNIALPPSIFTVKNLERR